MRRREFIAALGSAATWPLVARAQQSQNIRRIGILMPFPTGNATAQERVRIFREELRKRGWASSVNIQFDERWTVDNMELIQSAAENLVELKPDAILAIGGRVIPILMKLTRSIPIVVAALNQSLGATLRALPILAAMSPASRSWRLRSSANSYKRSKRLHLTLHTSR